MLCVCQDFKLSICGHQVVQKKKMASCPCVSWIYLKFVWRVCVLPARSRGSWSVLFQAGACCVWRWPRRSAPRTWWRCSEGPSPWHSGPAWQQTHTFSGPTRPNDQPPANDTSFSSGRREIPEILQKDWRDLRFEIRERRQPWVKIIKVGHTD